MKTNTQIGRRPLVTTALVLALLAGTSVYALHETKESHAAVSVKSAALPVVVQTLTGHKVRVWSEFSGRLHAVDSAEIRPEVGGRISEVLFEDGQNVKVGDILFVIDPRPYEAAVKHAEANLISARTNATFAKVEFDRAAGMMQSQAIAQRVYDERANAHLVADATVKAAEAELQQAQLNLEHAHVKAPISGRVSRAEITVGNLVQPGASAPLLTSIVSDQTIYADFEVDERTYIDNIRNAAHDDAHVPVQLTLSGDGARVYSGTIQSFDNRIDLASGTIRARAKFDNADGVLIPGMFVSVKLANGAEREELLVPDRAVSFDQNKKFVYVVGADNKVAYREVELGKQVQGQRIALKGVESGDRVIVDGIQHVRPDAIVDPTEATALQPRQISAN